MSGHSKWSRIKRQKGAADQARGQQFTLLANRIKQAAATNADPAANPALAEAISQAKAANMPQANIDRLLASASDKTTIPVTYEAFGPAGTALIIKAVTDNTNRTVSELRTILKKHDGSLGTPGSVAWKFTTSDDQEFTPQYPQTLTADIAKQVQDLTQELNNHPDITQVYTDSSR